MHWLRKLFPERDTIVYVKGTPYRISAETMSEIQEALLRGRIDAMTDRLEDTDGVTD